MNSSSCIKLLIFIICFSFVPAHLFSQEISQGNESIQSFEINILKNGDVDVLSIQTVPLVNGTYPFTIDGEDAEIPFENGIATFVLDDVNKKFHHIQATTDKGKSNQLIYGNSESSKKIPFWLSILPPLLAILFALLFREVVISLFAGVWLGAFIVNGMSLKSIFTGLLDSMETFVLGALNDSGHLSVMLFTFLIGGMVSIISRNGGMKGVVDKLSKYATSARNSQFITWALGIAIFFDDYANTLIVGNTMQPVTDKFRVSREKLAYVVDSTAAPVAATALVTTWIGFELGFLGDFSKSVGLEQGAYQLFLSSLKYAFYPILTLIFIWMLIKMKKDYGPMYAAEMRARETGKVKSTSIVEKSKSIEVQKDESEALDDLDAVEGAGSNWYNALIPILVLVGGTLISLFYLGGAFDKVSWQGEDSFIVKISTIMGNADSYVALLWGSLLGVITAAALTIGGKIMNIERTMDALVDGIKTMLPAIIILVLAWSLAKVTESLHTADYLTSLFQGNLSPKFLPLITFVLAASIAFSTGSSWGTMSILYPLILPAGWALCQTSGMELGQTMEIIYNIIAVVLAGSVLGDHCSPISDTTILSSLASDCNHIDHVRTQLPYALTVGFIAILMGTVLSVIGSPIWLNYLLGIGLLYSIIRFFGKDVPDYS